MPIKEKAGMKLSKHTSSMSALQRKELIKILKYFHSMEDLAKLTDPELHSLWLDDCEYENPYKK